MKYTYECPVHGRVEVDKPVAEAGRAEYCLADVPTDPRKHLVRFCGEPLRRIYETAGLIVRPGGWSLSAEDPRWGNTRREVELGEIDPHRTASIEVKEEPWSIDPARVPDLPETVKREVYQWAEANVSERWRDDPGVVGRDLPPMPRSQLTMTNEETA